MKEIQYPSGFPFVDNEPRMRKISFQFTLEELHLLMLLRDIRTGDPTPGSPMQGVGLIDLLKRLRGLMVDRWTSEASHDGAVRVQGVVQAIDNLVTNIERAHEGIAALRAAQEATRNPMPAKGDGVMGVNPGAFE